MKLWDANLQVYEKNSFTYPSSYILPSFSKNASRLHFPKRLLKYASKIFFKKQKQKVMLLVVYLLITIHLSQLPSRWMWHLTLFWVRFCQVNWNLLQHITKITKTFFFSQPVLWYVVLFDKKLIVFDHSILFWHLYQTHFQQ